MKKTLLAAMVVLTLLVAPLNAAVAAPAATTATASDTAPPPALRKCIDDALAPGANADNDGFLQKLARLKKFRQCAQDAGFTLSLALECVDKSIGDTLTARYEQIKQCLIGKAQQAGVAALGVAIIGYIAEILLSSSEDLTSEAEAFLADLKYATDEEQQHAAALTNLLAEQTRSADPSQLVPGLTDALHDFQAWATDTRDVSSGWQEDLKDLKQRYDSYVQTAKAASPWIKWFVESFIPNLPWLTELTKMSLKLVWDLLSSPSHPEAPLGPEDADPFGIDGMLGDLEEMNKALDQMNSALDKANAATAQINHGLDGMNKGINVANAGMDQLNRAVVGMNRGMDQMNRGVGEMNHGVKQMNDAVANLPDIKASLTSGFSLNGALDNAKGPILGNRNPEDVLQELADSMQRDANMSFLLDLMPGLGDAKGLLEAFQGRDLATGEQLSGVERALGATFVLGYLKDLGVGADMLRGGGKLGNALGSLRQTKDAVSALRAGGKLPAGWTTRVLDRAPAGMSSKVTWTEAVLGSGGIKLLYTSEGSIYAATDDGLHYLGKGENTRKLPRCLTHNSFSPDTRVLLADGREVAIKDVRVGQRVLSTDPDSQTPDAEPITEVLVNTDTELTDLTLSDGSVLHTTAQHPFWAPDQRTWTGAAGLNAGAHLSSPFGTVATVRSVRTFTGSSIMYNLTIARLHTYYVLAGNTPVLVHNANCGVRVSPVASDWATKGAHVHIGADEVRIFPDGKGGIGAEGIRLRGGMASEKSVQEALTQIRSNRDLRADLISKARSAMEHMNKHNWGNSSNRASEMKFLIGALEKMG